MTNTIGTVYFDNGTHRNIMLEDADVGGIAVQANQHVIINNGVGMILDPGGHKVYTKVRSSTFAALKGGHLKYIFLSHQDPDIVAAINGWLMTTDADAYVSSLWIRFVAHFGLDHIVSERLKPIPDEGMCFDLGGNPMYVLPAHFLHSEGNFHLYDPTAKILYTGDLGASLGGDYAEVTDFDSHLKYITGFHKRYMVSGKVLKMWANMVRQLDIEIIAPQHGAIFKGRDMVKKFIDWADTLECGIDLIEPVFKLPAALTA